MARTKAPKPWLAERRAGILLHPSSLPGPHTQGDIGHEAYRFVEFAAAAGMGVWQMLPLGPTHADGSPYQCLSVHAANPLLISLDWLVDRGWLAAPGSCDADGRRRALVAAHAVFADHAQAEWQRRYTEFCDRHAGWLDDYALFIALRMEQEERPWMEWPVHLRDRDPAALDGARRRLARALDQVRFEQFVFFTQWGELREYARHHQLLLFGDLPIFVAHDSAEVWAHRELFEVDASGVSERVAGVPPDYFSATGQLWGNPLYRWEALEADGFAWWIARMGSQLELFDLVRIDHFRGLEAYWAIPAEAETAMSGQWEKAPGAALLKAMDQAFHALPVVAEDLGLITEEVHALRRKFALPGMLVLQFAFDGDPDNIYLPHAHSADMVAYTATHDNDTTVGWFDALDESAREYVYDYLGRPAEPMPWPLIRAALASVARLAVVPMQDLLTLGTEARMNLPGTCEGNWQWRYDWRQVEPNLAERCRQLVQLYGRAVEGR